MHTIYRIYTEDVSRKDIIVILDNLFDSYSIFTADGVWKGDHEDGLVIEIIESHPPLSNSIDSKVWLAAQQIKRHNVQEAVMVTKQPIEVCMV